LASLAGFCLLVLCYMLPTGPMKRNMSQGANAFLTEGSNFIYADGYESSILAENTDGIMLSKTIWSSGNPVKDAVEAPMLISSDPNATQETTLIGLLRDDPQYKDVQNYARYWHGYLIVLKPLFCFFSFSDLRILNISCQLILIGLTAWFMCDRGFGGYMPAFVSTMVFWNPATTGMSLQYSDCFYISLLGICAALYFSRHREKTKTFWYVLLWCGILTSFFDFLTYPLATLGMPLLMMLIIRRESRDVAELQLSGGEARREPVSIRKEMRFTVGGILSWAFGYVGMWAMKWIIGTLSGYDNVIADAVNTVLFRSSTESADGSTGKITRIGAVAHVARTLCRPAYLFFAIVFIIALFLYFDMGVRIGKKAEKARVVRILNGRDVLEEIPVLFTAILPAVWIFFAANHSYIHVRYVFRIFGITIFAVCTMMIHLLRKKFGYTDR